MAKGDNYEGLNITIDTRERDTPEAQKKNITRMKYVRDLFESLGACVEREKIDFCDYSITGTFYRKTKPFEVNIGIQYKTLNGDFFPSIETLPAVLFNAHSIFSHVALVVEENGHEILLNEDYTDGMFQNYSMQAGCDKTGTGLYSAYKNFMQSMAECKVQARSIRKSEDFPMEMVAILKYVNKPFHDGLCVRPQNIYEELSNSFVKFPGVTPSSVRELLYYIPNLKGLCDCSLEDLQTILDPLHGKMLHRFINSSERKQVCSNHWLEFYKEQEEKVKDPLTMIKTKPRTIEEICARFGFSQEGAFKTLMELQMKGKVYFDSRAKLWKAGLNPTPKVAIQPEMDIGV